MKSKAIQGVAASVAGVLLAYRQLLRPRILNWGASDEEIERKMPGDRFLANPALRTTRVITIDTTADRVWPWLVQMGPRPRAGVYTYDWMERALGIDIKNADRILPEFQHLEPGEFFALRGDGQGLRVRDVHPEKSIVFQWEPALSTWEFGLYPVGATTRLVSRNRIPGNGAGFWLGMFFLMEPGSLLMERKMLQGIRDRAESYDGARVVAPTPREVIDG